MSTVVKIEAVQDRNDRLKEVRPAYLESLTLVERLHRRLLDVIKDEFRPPRTQRCQRRSGPAALQHRRQGIDAGELRTRGYYLGSNVSYNVKKLVETGYLPSRPVAHRPPFGAHQSH